ncbi:hypothetical protein [Actinospica sp.]|nr:hypothetical protein [Actinospica sp.]HWG22814.1 hypothetical protein [Actinospica sp.]
MSTPSWRHAMWSGGIDCGHPTRLSFESSRALPGGSVEIVYSMRG